MNKILLMCLSFGIVFSEATLKVSSITTTNDGVDIQIDYMSDYDIAGYQFTFLNGNSLTLTGAANSVPDSDFQLSAGASNGVVLGFSLTSSAIPASASGYSPLCVISANVNNGFDGTTVLLDAKHDPDGEGTTLLLSDVDACGDCCGTGSEGSCTNNFHEASWVVGTDTFTLDNDLIAPISFSLGDNYPNPFNPSTSIDFSIAEPGIVNLSIFDASGRLVKTLVSENRGVGSYTEVWNGTNDSGINVSAGMYLYKIDSGSFVETKKMLLIK